MHLYDPLVLPRTQIATCHFNNTLLSIGYNIVVKGIFIAYRIRQTRLTYSTKQPLWEGEEE